MNLLKKALIPLMLIAAIAVQGCKSDSTGPDNNGTPVTNTKPGTGSTYTFNSVVTESGETTESTVTYTVLANIEESTTGRAGAYVYTPNSGGDILTLAFETNGNVSILLPYITPDSAGTFWFTIPVTGSGGTTNRLVTDFDFLGTHTVVRSSASLAGTENITINGVSYSAKKIKITSNASFTEAGQTFTSTDDDFFWWVPEIGFYARKEEGGQIVNGVQEELTIETLTGFDIN